MIKVKDILNDRTRGINYLKEDIIGYDITFKTDCDLIRSLINKDEEYIIIQGKVMSIDASRVGTPEYMINIIEKRSNKKIQIGTNTSNLQYEKNL